MGVLKFSEPIVRKDAIQRMCIFLVSKQAGPGGLGKEQNKEGNAVVDLLKMGNIWLYRSISCSLKGQKIKLNQKRWKYA